MFVLGLIVGAGVLIFINYLKIKNSGNKAELIIEKAKKDSEKIKRDYLFEAKEEAHKLKLEIEKEVKEKKNEIKESEDRLLQRENNIDRRDLALQNRENSLEERENNLIDKQKKIQEATDEMENIKKEQLEKLENISKFTKEQAKDAIMKDVEEKMDKEIALYIKEREADAKLEVDDKAKELLVNSMQKYAADITNEQTVSVISLPSDEMKGRIIGREGRNIRTIESVTGVDLIIDDTPEAIVISSFDPLRREIARLTLETLIKDGRIHPARIEELYDKMCNEVGQQIKEYGKKAIYELGLSRMDPELVEIIGKLHFRSSYGQNALKHSIEVARISGIIAGELGVNVNLAKRAGLLHDIGKAIDFEMEGSHVQIGMDLAKKYNEDEVVINSIGSHHGDMEPTSVIAVIVAIADTISASRPGARNDSSENYFQRLEQLEKIGNEIKGVEKTFAVQAGRELRVMVKPDEVDDLRSFAIAREIKDRIENEMQYPGTIKVTVIRETRATEEAK
ncbi:MAG: ribonuclease Y [Bacilli bacterium]|nr:ribonuclease Y [Bacilli bacterium]